MNTLLDCLPLLQEKLSDKPRSLYPQSWNQAGGGQLCMADFGAYDALLFWGENCPFAADEVVSLHQIPLAKVPLTHETALLLHQLLPFTAPQPVLGKARSFGTGDRLGIATAGHIRAIQKYDVYPVFAQQSMRELKLMGRTYDDVLDCVTFQVLQEGFKRGYGADGDHLKSLEDVQYAIRCGYTMITLDCSEHIHNSVTCVSDMELDMLCPLPAELEQEYCDKTFELAGASLHFTRRDLHQAYLIYNDAISFTKTIYDACIAGSPVELEISIDETETTTTPAQHFFVANELKKAGVQFKTMAPRFCGEFQKGIDYIGDLQQFDEEFKIHVAIAESFGYKISVHSGSDKFTVYPSVGRMTHGRFHVKTSGTSWLEALRLVARTDPALFREIYAYAIGVFPEARANYHVSTELQDIPDISGMPDADLSTLLDIPASRQLLHITYGKIMNERNADDSLRFKTRLYQLWRNHRTEYDEILEQHITHHLQLLFDPA